MDNCTRRDKLNSQFIVTKISILHAGGQSEAFFKPVESAGKLCLNFEILEALPSN